MDLDFTSRRSRSLARVAAYTLLALFLLAVVASVLPLQALTPSRGFVLFGDLLDRSTLPVIALFLLFHGLAGDAMPAVWEVRLAARLRPLLRLVAVLYLLSILAIVGFGQQVEQQDIARLNQQLAASQKSLARFRETLESAPDGASLQRLLATQSGLQQALQQQAGPAALSAPLPEQKRRLAQLVDRAESNLRAQNLVTLANTSGNFVRQTLRLSLTALALALFHLAASQIWPRSVAGLVLALREEQRRREEESAEADPQE